MTLSKRKLVQDRRIFFPWEARGGVRPFLVLGRVGPVLALLTVVSFIGWIGARERHAAGVRRTRVALSSMRPAVERYLLESDGACPPNLDELLPLTQLSEVPRDGWGHRLRLVCPSVREDIDYLLMSDGPDGLPGGLDRIEY